MKLKTVKLSLKVNLINFYLFANKVLNEIVVGYNQRRRRKKRELNKKMVQKKKRTDTKYNANGI